MSKYVVFLENAEICEKIFLCISHKISTPGYDDGESLPLNLFQSFVHGYIKAHEQSTHTHCVTVF